MITHPTTKLPVLFGEILRNLQKGSGDLKELWEIAGLDNAKKACRSSPTYGRSLRYDREDYDQRP